MKKKNNLPIHLPSNIPGCTFNYRSHHVSFLSTLLINHILDLELMTILPYSLAKTPAIVLEYDI